VASDQPGSAWMMIKLYLVFHIQKFQERTLVDRKNSGNNAFLLFSPKINTQYMLFAPKRSAK